MNDVNYTAALEAMLFASGEPVELSRLAQALDLHEAAVRELLLTMEKKYSQPDSGLTLLTLGSCYQLTTKAEYASPVKATLEIRRNTPLSNAAMEVLAIVAYNQPVTRSFIEQVRGVDSSSIVTNLVEKGLIEEAGRLELPGRPVAFRTGSGFLRCFGISSLKELPPLPDESGQVMLDEIVAHAEDTAN